MQKLKANQKIVVDIWAGDLYMGKCRFFRFHTAKDLSRLLVANLSVTWGDHRKAMIESQWATVLWNGRRVMVGVVTILRRLDCDFKSHTLSVPEKFKRQINVYEVQYLNIWYLPSVYMYVLMPFFISGLFTNLTFRIKKKYRETLELHLLIWTIIYIYNRL